jgi:hypothetical protein
MASARTTLTWFELLSYQNPGGWMLYETCFNWSTYPATILLSLHNHYWADFGKEYGTILTFLRYSVNADGTALDQLMVINLNQRHEKFKWFDFLLLLAYYSKSELNKELWWVFWRVQHLVSTWWNMTSSLYTYTDW